MDIKLVEPRKILIQKLMEETDSTSAMLLLYLANEMDENNKIIVSLSILKEQFSMHPPYISKKLNNLAKQGLLKIDKEMDSYFNRVKNIYTLPDEFKAFKGWLAK